MFLNGPKSLSWLLELHFTKENDLKIHPKEYKKVRNQARSVVQIDKNRVLHLVYTIKNVDKKNSTPFPDKNGSKVAAFYA